MAPSSFNAVEQYKSKRKPIKINQEQKDFKKQYKNTVRVVQYLQKKKKKYLEESENY